MAIVYGLHAGDGNIRYVGMTTRSIESRFKEHVKLRNSGKKFPVYDWMRKYGDLVEVIIIESYKTNDEAKHGEINYIAKIGRENLLNCTNGGDGVTGWTEEQKAKMSEIKKAQSKEIGLKISKTKTGKTLSEEHKRNVGKSRLGYKHSPETRAKMSKSKQNQSPETRAKISQAQKARHAAGFYSKKGD